MSEMQKYDDAVKAIKTAILQSQYEAARSVNEKQLRLYYGVGKYISANSRKGFWGKGAIDAISEQLQNELPGLRGFSARNLRNMRTFYEEWAGLESPSDSKSPQFLASAETKLDCGNSNLAVATAKMTDGLFWQMRLPKTPEKLRKALPDIEDLRRLLDGDKEGGVSNERD